MDGISRKRKEREDFWIDAELKVRRICGYKERRSKKVNRRTKELEEGRSQDIRDMFGLGGGGAQGSSGDPLEEEMPEVDYEEESREIGKKLKLDWDSLDKSWKMAMQRRAKKVRGCHDGHHKGCVTCGWARKRAHREWEMTHPREVARKGESKRYKQSSIQ